ncbi:transposase [Salinibacter grassmerensis]|uniref:transposase n=1 Tax=Salinibacter grassmerensis TaxID=3040353 RepID=UPI003C6E66CF
MDIRNRFPVDGSSRFLSKSYDLNASTRQFFDTPFLTPVGGELPICFRAKRPIPGRTARDNRLFLDAVLWIVRTGSPWRELSDHFGK